MILLDKMAEEESATTGAPPPRRSELRLDRVNVSEADADAPEANGIDAG